MAHNLVDVSADLSGLIGRIRAEIKDDDAMTGIDYRLRAINAELTHVRNQVRDLRRDLLAATNAAIYGYDVE